MTLGARAMLSLLVLQFLLGMFANLFVTFPTTTESANPIAQIFISGSAILIAHVLTAALLFGLSTSLLVLAAFTPGRRLVAVASLGFVFIGIAFSSGMLFVVTGYSNDALSYEMAVGFILAFLTYGAIAGRRAGEARGVPTSQTRGRPVGIAITEAIAGAILLFGGLQLVVLGRLYDVLAWHGPLFIILGVATLLAAVALWKNSNRAGHLALVVNAAGAVSSVASETILVGTVSQELNVVGSVGGTVIAIGILSAAIYYLAVPENRAFLRHH